MDFEMGLKACEVNAGHSGLKYLAERLHMLGHAVK